jgi:hypothetical protein
MAKPLTAEQAIFLLQDALMPMLKAEHRVTRAVLEAVPADKPDYRPDPNAKTAMELVRHIAAAENRFLETTVNGEFNATAGGIPDNVKTPAQIAAWYADRFEKNCEALSKLSADQLLKMVHLRRKLRQRASQASGGLSSFQFPVDKRCGKKDNAETLSSA